jgi:AraC family transcriptional activator of pyochelin receptor
MGVIEVSPEMLTLLGSGCVSGRGWPGEPVAFEFLEQNGNEPLEFTFHAHPTARSLSANAAAPRLVLLVARSACERLLGGPLELADGSTYLLPAELRPIAFAIRDCAMPTAAAVPYRLAKSIELICEMMRTCGEGQLLTGAAGDMSCADCRRIATARQLIDDRWKESLSLADIARRCGLNRSKLSRGFRALYGCTVAEAVAERRLAEARRQLIATDLPVGLIGYHSGYQNNASFSRAFCRRFGVPPSDFRLRGLAA